MIGKNTTDPDEDKLSWALQNKHTEKCRICGEESILFGLQEVGVTIVHESCLENDKVKD